MNRIVSAQNKVLQAIETPQFEVQHVVEEEREDGGDYSNKDIENKYE